MYVILLLNVTFSHNKESLFFRLCILSVITTVGLTLVILVNPLLIQPSYCLSVTDKSYQPIQFATIEQNTTKHSGFTEYTGLDKDFSLKYPSDWALEPKTNRFESTDLKMTSPNGASNGFITMEDAIFDPEMSSTLKEFKQKDIEKYIDMVFPRFLSGFARYF